MTDWDVDVLLLDKATPQDAIEYIVGWVYSGWDDYLVTECEKESEQKALTVALRLLGWRYDKSENLVPIGDSDG